MVFSNYYPYGLKHKGYNNLVTDRHHPYMFGGKENNPELGLEWYDVSARNYDPALGRWMNIDPLAEQMRRYSPYSYAFSNPVYWFDPDGKAPFSFQGIDPIKKIKKIVEQAKEGIRKGSQAIAEELRSRGLDAPASIIESGGEATARMIENGLDGQIDIKLGVKFTLGARLAAGFKGLAGFDANIASAEMLELSYQGVLDENGNYTHIPVFDYANKDDEQEITIGGSVSTILTGTKGYEYSYTRKNKTGEKTKKKHTVKGVNGVNYSYQEDDGEITARKSTGINSSFGLFGVFEIQAEVGVEGKAKVK